MNTSVVQRWRGRRDSYRPAGETINTRSYEVATIADDSTARAFVEAHHYSASYPAARRRYGLYRGPDLVGVAVLSEPMCSGVLAALPCPRESAAELGRFVLLDDVPANGETWMLARVFDLARRDGIEGIVSFSDSTPRTTSDGRVVFAGHVGTIYQASNAIYQGRAAARTVRLLPDGTVLSARAISKIRGRERGWRYASALLVAHGAGPLSEGDDVRAWLAEWLPRLTRTLRTQGNHRYLFGLTPALKRALPASLSYPKLSLRAA